MWPFKKRQPEEKPKYIVVGIDQLDLAKGRVITMDVGDIPDRQARELAQHAITRIRNEKPEWDDPLWKSHIVVILLRPGQKVQQLNEVQMRAAGWVKIPDDYPLLADEIKSLIGEYSLRTPAYGADEADKWLIQAIESILQREIQNTDTKRTAEVVKALAEGMRNG